MGNYISISDVDNFADGLTTSQKNTIVDSAEHTVERITRDYFYPRGFNININGSDQDRIFVPFVQDILYVSKVEIFDTEISNYNYDENSIFSKYDYDLFPGVFTTKFPEGNSNINIVGTKGWAEKIDLSSVSGDFVVEETITGGTSGATAIIKRVEPDNLLIVGRSDTSFTASETITGGTSSATAETTEEYNNTPFSIKQAAIKLAKYYNDETLYTSYSGFDEERLGDYSYDMTNMEYLSGIIEVDRLLRNYILKKPVLGAV